MKKKDKSRVFCTIVNKDYLPLAITLSQSLSAFHHEQLVILCIDFKVEKYESDSNIKFVSISDLGIEVSEIDELFRYHDIVELATLLKPILLRFLIDSYSVVIFLDPDVFVMNYIPIMSQGDSKEVIGAITPHRMSANQETRNFEEDFLKHGIYNLGYIEVNERSKPFLSWWIDRVLWNCSRYPASPFFTDQKWIDLASVLFNLRVVRDPGFNVAPWNLDERDVSLKDEKLFSKSAPVHFVHFSQGASSYLRGNQAPVWRKNTLVGQAEITMIEKLEAVYVKSIKRSEGIISLMNIESRRRPTTRGSLYRSYLREKVKNEKSESFAARMFLSLFIVLDATRLLSLSLFINGLRFDIIRIKAKFSSLFRST